MKIPFFIQRTIALFKRLTKPSDALVSSPQRRQAEILAGMQLITVPFGFVIYVVQCTFHPYYVRLLPLLLPAFVLGFVLYFLARSRYARIGCWTQVCNTFVTLSIGPAFLPDKNVTAWFLVIPILFAQVLLGDLAAMMLGVLSILELVLYQVGVFDGIQVTWMQYAFLSLVTGTVVLSGYRRTLVARDEAELLVQKGAQNRQLLETIFDGTVLIREGIILEVNESFGRLIGLAPPALIGTPIERYVESLNNSTSRTNVGFGYERVGIHHENGEVLQAERLIMDVEQDYGTAQFVAIRDISEQILLQNQLQHSRRMASVGHLAATVAHEINNPLAVVQLRLDLMRSLSFDEAKTGHLRVIADHVSRITHIVRNLRSFSNPHGVSLESVSLAQVVHTAHQIAEKSLGRFTLDYKERPLDLEVRATVEHMEQVFVNLFLYVRESVDPSSTIEVRAYREGDWVKVLVRDERATLDVYGVQGLLSGSPTQLSELAGSAVGLAISWGIVQEFEGIMVGSVSPDGGGQIEVMLRRKDEPVVQTLK